MRVPSQHPVSCTQGSVLSPLLYNLYTADLPTQPNITTATFADDTVIFASNRNLKFVIPPLQRHLDSLEQWTTDWRIKINSDKSTAVHFTRRRGALPTQPHFQNYEIETQPHAKYLGVLLDKRLTFKQHITNTPNKAIQRLLAIYPILRSPTLSIKTKLHLYKMMIRPILLYAAPVWHNAPKSSLQKLQTVQNRAARMITGFAGDTRITQLHEDLELPYLHEIIDRQNRNFWLRLRNSNIPTLTTIGTLEPQRKIHKMPRPPENL